MLAYNRQLAAKKINSADNTVASTELQDRIQEIFNDVDIDGSGTLNLPEVEQVLSEVLGVADNTVEEMFRKLDVNANNLIEHTEFQMGALEYGGNLSVSMLQKALRQFDDTYSSSTRKSANARALITVFGKSSGVNTN